MVHAPGSTSGGIVLDKSWFDPTCVVPPELEYTCSLYCSETPSVVHSKSAVVLVTAPTVTTGQDALALGSCFGNGAAVPVFFGFYGNLNSVPFFAGTGVGTIESNLRFWAHTLITQLYIIFGI